MLIAIGPPEISAQTRLLGGVRQGFPSAQCEVSRWARACAVV